MRKIGANIKVLRKNKGLSQLELGKLIGKSESMIGAYENERCEMPVSVAYTIAEKTNTDIGWLMTGETKQEPEKEYDAMLRIYSMEDRLTVIQILAKNGYDVGQNKKPRTNTGKTLDYFVHAKDLSTNADTSK